MRLTAAAKDDLFNMFHNKSDDFLAKVGNGEIRIAGPAKDALYSEFEPFDEHELRTTSFQPDLVVPGIGYQATLCSLTREKKSVGDFFLGCCHVKHDNLFAVGYARPIIGNIPTISEMQARYICSLIAQKSQRPIDIKQQHEKDQQEASSRFAKLDLEAVYPVEMFPYCDRLARLMGMSIGPSFFQSPLRWWRTMTSPATTLHYSQNDRQVQALLNNLRRHMPWSLVLFILLMKPVDWIWKFWKHLKG